MEGYDSMNYRVTSTQGQFVLKAYQQNQRIIEVIKAENEVLKDLEDNSNRYPKVIANSATESLTFDNAHPDQCFRLLTYVTGTFWGDIEQPSATLLRSYGRFLGQIDHQLSKLNPVAIRAKRMVWDLDHFLLNEPLIEFIDCPHERKLVDYFFLQYKEHVLSQLPILRKSLIHNDANDWNVLTKDGEVSGIIDFGDMVYSSLINELAVGLAYVLMDIDDPIGSAVHVIQAYHLIIPLKESELDLIYYLIAARLCTSVCNSAKTKREKPDSDYITISERPAWDLLGRWISISPYRASEAFRKACGYKPKRIQTSSEALQARKKYLGPGLSLSYDRPIYMRSAAFQYMYDSEGNALLDAYNNIKHVGHCHPHVVNAGRRAMAHLNTNTRYIFDSLTNYAQHLLSYFPDELSKVYFVNSGSAASDLALRMARVYTRRDTMAVVKHGYHGNSSSGIEVSHYKYAHKGGSGRQGHIIEAELPDCYRGKYTGDDGGRLYARDFIEINESATIGAFIAEPIVGCGGQVPLATGYLNELYPYIRSQGGVCISDEVQVGFGRIGTHYWGYEGHGVLPDIVILGKPIGNGHPMAAVVCTDEIADAFDNGMEFFSSFGGNPVSCAIGKAVLEVIENESLQQNALLVGNYMMDRFREIQQYYDVIGDVRGAGLFIGIDIILPQSDKAPNTVLASVIKNELRELSILVSTDGPSNNVIKIKPPLCFNRANADRLVEAFQEVLNRRVT